MSNKTDPKQAALAALDAIFLTICPTLEMVTGIEREQGRITLEQYNEIRAALTPQADDGRA